MSLFPIRLCVSASASSSGLTRETRWNVPFPSEKKNVGYVYVIDGYETKGRKDKGVNCTPRHKILVTPLASSIS